MPRKYRVDLEGDEPEDVYVPPTPAEVPPPATPVPGGGGSDSDTFDWYKGRTPPAEPPGAPPNEPPPPPPPPPPSGGGETDWQKNEGGQGGDSGLINAAVAALVNAARNYYSSTKFAPVNMGYDVGRRVAQGEGVKTALPNTISQDLGALLKSTLPGVQAADRIFQGAPPPPPPMPIEDQSPEARQERAVAAQAQRMAAQEQQQQRREAEREGAPEVGKPGTGTPPPAPPEPPKDESQPLPPPPVNTGVVSATGMSPQKIAETIDTNLVFTTLAANMGWTNEQKSQFRNYVIDLVNKGGAVPNLKDPNVVAQVVNAAAKTYNPAKTEAPTQPGGQGFLGSNPYQPGSKAWNDWQIEHDRVVNQSKGKGGGGGGGSSYGGTPAPTPTPAGGQLNFSEIPFPTGYDAALERVLLAAGFDKLGNKQFSGSGKVTEALLYSLINDPQQQAWLRNFLLQQKLWKV